MGRHLNDTGPLPRKPVNVCPGLLGGVETPMATADGRVFVPYVDLCFRESSHGLSALDFFSVDYAKGHGGVVALDAATGKRLWTRRFASPNFGCATVANDVVFTATYDGTIYGLSAKDGHTLWTGHARAGINACPAVAGGYLLVSAGTEHPSFDEAGARARGVQAGAIARVALYQPAAGTSRRLRPARTSSSRWYSSRSRRTNGS